MGGFCYISRHDRSPELVAAARRATRQQFTASGFGPPIAYDVGHGVLDFYEKIGYPSVDHIVLPDGFAVVAGTFLYGGAVGAEALRRFATAEDLNDALSRAEGHFAMVLCRHGWARLLRDRVGALEVFF